MVAAVAEIQTYLVEGNACIVKIRGDIDDAAVELIVRDGSATVVDLLDARVVDVDALDALVAGSSDVVFIAERPLLDALELIALHRPVRTAPTLAAALS